MAPAVVSARQAQNMTPDYEVKLQLNPSQVLDAAHDVLKPILDSFNVSEAPSQMNVQFLDTCSAEIYAAGWSLRMRKLEIKPNLELNYKKRYNIDKEDIVSALNKANEDGFTSEDVKYEAQIEWGYAKQTLSISRDKDVPHIGDKPLELADTLKSRAILTQEAPSKFDDWGPGDKWGTTLLARSGIYGPISAKRWAGKWNDTKKFYVEVWPLLNSEGTGIDYIVEASFKADNYATASGKRADLMMHLGKMGWLLAEDSLKTKLIMERYTCPRMLGRVPSN
jgi:hypothetical protein